MKKLSKSQLRKIIKETIAKYQKRQLNEVEIPCCTQGTGWDPDCCGDARKDCCDFDKKWGMGTSGCCEKIVPRGPIDRADDRMTMGEAKRMLQEGKENCCVEPNYNEKCCDALEKFCCRRNLPCCDNDELWDTEKHSPGGGGGGSDTGMGDERGMMREQYMPNPAFHSRMVKLHAKFGCQALHNKSYTLADKLNTPGKGPRWKSMLRNKIYILRDVSVSSGCGAAPVNI